MLCTALHFTTLHCSALHFTTLHFTSLLCSALICSALLCSARVIGRTSRHLSGGAAARQCSTRGSRSGMECPEGSEFRERRKSGGGVEGGGGMTDMAELRM